MQGDEHELNRPAGHEVDAFAMLFRLVDRTDADRGEDFRAGISGVSEKRHLFEPRQDPRDSVELRVRKRQQLRDFVAQRGMSPDHVKAQHERLRGQQQLVKELRCQALFGRRKRRRIRSTARG